MIKNGGAPTISQHYVYLEKLKNGGGHVLVHIVAWCRSGPHDVGVSGFPGTQTADFQTVGLQIVGAMLGEQLYRSKAGGLRL